MKMLIKKLRANLDEVSNNSPHSLSWLYLFYFILVTALNQPAFNEIIPGYGSKGFSFVKFFCIRARLTCRPLDEIAIFLISTLWPCFQSLLGPFCCGRVSACRYCPGVRWEYAAVGVADGVGVEGSLGQDVLFLVTVTNLIQPATRRTSRRQDA